MFEILLELNEVHSIINYWQLSIQQCSCQQSRLSTSNSTNTINQLKSVLNMSNKPKEIQVFFDDNSVEFRKLEISLKEKINQLIKAIDYFKQKYQLDRQIDQVFKRNTSGIIDAALQYTTEIKQQSKLILSTLNNEKIERDNLYRKLSQDLMVQVSNWNCKFNQETTKSLNLNRRLTEIERFIIKQTHINQKVENDMKQITNSQRAVWSSMETYEPVMKSQEHTLQNIKKLERISIDTINKVADLENFIDKYEPIYTYAQISETLYSILGQNFREKLNARDKKMFQEFSSITAHDNGIPNLKRKVLKHREIIEAILLRNKPYEKVLQAQLNLPILNDQQRLEEKLKDTIKEQARRLQKKLGSIEQQLKKEYTCKIQQLNQCLIEYQDTSEVNLKMFQKKIDQLETQISQMKMTSMKMQEKTINPSKIDKQTSHELKHQKLPPDTKRDKSPELKISRQSVSKKQFVASKYRRLHDASQKLQNMSTSCLIPSSLIENRRKSLIEMRRNKVSALNYNL